MTPELRRVIQKTIQYKREAAFKALYEASKLLEAVQAECKHPNVGVNPVVVHPNDVVKKVGYKCPDCFKIWEEVVCQK